ncbi:MAG: hypothetical protein ACI831_001362, partial [Candidatus Azotimanducaceae bacterium]
STSIQGSIGFRFESLDKVCLTAVACTYNREKRGE